MFNVPLPAPLPSSVPSIIILLVPGMASAILPHCTPCWWGWGAAGEQGPLHGNSAAGQVWGELLHCKDEQQGERQTAPILLFWTTFRKRKSTWIPFFPSDNTGFCSLLLVYLFVSTAAEESALIAAGFSMEAKKGEQLESYKQLNT